MYQSRLSRHTGAVLKNKVEYLTYDGRHVGVWVTPGHSVKSAIAALQELTASDSRKRLISAHTSWHDDERVSLPHVYAALNGIVHETGLENHLGIGFVHGPPHENTRRHIHWTIDLERANGFLATIGQTDLRRAAESVATRLGFVLATAGDERHYSHGARSFELWTGRMSLETWLRERVLAGRDFQDPHHFARHLMLHGIIYTTSPRGGDAFVDVVGGVGVRASAVGREWTRVALEHRFGATLAAEPPDLTPQVTYHTDPHAWEPRYTEEQRTSHQAARAAWSEIYEPRIRAELTPVTRAYQRRCREIAGLEDQMLEALSVVDAVGTAPQAARAATKALAATLRSEATKDYGAEQRAVRERYPTKPSRLLRRWVSSLEAPPARPIATRLEQHRDADVLHMAEQTLRAVPSVDNGRKDLMLGNIRIGTDDGKTVVLADESYAELAARWLSSDRTYRVEGSAEFRDRMRTLGVALESDVRDGGTPVTAPPALHADLPKRPAERLALALLDHLRIRPTLDGQPYRMGHYRPADTHAIESVSIPDPRVIIVTGSPQILQSLPIAPAAICDSHAIIVVSSDDDRERAIAALERHGARQTNGIPGDAVLRYPPYTPARVPRPASSRSLFDELVALARQPLQQEPERQKHPRPLSQERPRARRR